MHPEVWGKHFWRVIHLCALGYPHEPTETDKTHYRQFFATLGNVLPCPKCQRNYYRHLQTLPISLFLDSRDRLFKWTVHLHNIVNKETGKLQWSIEFAENYYNTMIEKRKLEIQSQKKQNDENKALRIVIFTSLALLAITVIFLIIAMIRRSD